MKEHYKLTDKQFKLLEAQGVTMRELYLNRANFFITAEVPISPVCLMLVADKHGNFLESQDTVIKKIAFACWCSLDDTETKMRIAEHVDYICNGYPLNEFEIGDTVKVFQNPKRNKNYHVGDKGKVLRKNKDNCLLIALNTGKTWINAEFVEIV